MCGIAGVFDRHGAGHPEAVARMLTAMEHRGPDGSGTFAEGPVVLGHRRLAVLDPTQAGAQPMTDASGRYVCTFNGAIYNYRELRAILVAHGYAFRSASDTEVLLAAFDRWGVGSLHRFNGMFAFAIYDRVSGTLFCARDRLGVKPFVYTSNPRWFAFASEHKALIAAGLATQGVSPAAVYEFIARGFITSGRSFYEDLRTLPPGSALTIGPGGHERLWEWWNPARTTGAEEPPGSWADAVREVIEDSVSLRLRADVPVGAHLSGGLDSSAVVAAAVRTGGSDVVTFTGAFAGVPHADERVYSRALTDALGLRRVEVELNVDDLAGVFDRVVWHLDEPVAGPGVLPQQLVYDTTALHGIKVVLGGQGGDELFGGYLRHRGLHFKTLLTRSTSPLQRGLAAFELCRMMSSEWRRLGRTAARVPDESLDPEFVASVDPGLRAEVRRTPLRFGSAGALMRWDLRNYLPALLHADDRISMASSLESRTPLLDYRLVELASAIPDRWQFRRGVPKPILRDAVAPWLPPVVARRRDKRGFPTPLDQWNTRPAIRKLVHEVLRPGDGRGAVPPIFSAAYLAHPELMTPAELWTVLSIQAWLRALDVGSPASAAAGPVARRAS